MSKIIVSNIKAYDKDGNIVDTFVTGELVLNKVDTKDSSVEIGITNIGTVSVKSYTRSILNKFMMLGISTRQEIVNRQAIRYGVSPRVVLLAFYHKNSRVRNKNMTRILKSIYKK